MMAAAQPFLSGAISKTVNLPGSATVADCTRVFSLSWKLGLKAIALYRDGSKLSQPLSANRDSEEDEVAGLVVADAAMPLPERVRVAALSTVEADHHPSTGPGRSGLHDSAVWEATRWRPTPVVLQTLSMPDGVASGLFGHNDDEAKHAVANDVAIAMAVGLQHGVPLSRFLDAFRLSAAVAENSDEPLNLLDRIVRKLHLENVVDSDPSGRETSA